MEQERLESVYEMSQEEVWFFFPKLWKLRCKVEKACKIFERILPFSLVEMRKGCDLKEMGRKNPE